MGEMNTKSGGFSLNGWGRIFQWLFKRYRGAKEIIFHGRPHRIKKDLGACPTGVFHVTLNTWIWRHGKSDTSQSNMLNAPPFLGNFMRWQAYNHLVQEGRYQRGKDKTSYLLLLKWEQSVHLFQNQDLLFKKSESKRIIKIGRTRVCGQRD